MASSMKEKAVDYFLKADCNCAESMFRGACDTLGLSITPDAIHAIGPFGGGLGCGETCGAMAGSAGALGVLLIETRAHACPQIKPAVSEMTARFLKEFGSLRCEDLKPKYFTEETRCSTLVAKTAEILEELTKELTEKKDN
jgi:C_GCAxxG_C_C family probable redox protein